MPNGIDILLADHRNVGALFAQFDQSGDANLIGQVIDALKAHDDAEQAALYPFAGTLLGNTTLIERAAAAHSTVKKQFDVIGSLEGAPLIDAFRKLRQIVDKYVTDEERNLFPKLAEQASPQQLEALGARLLQAKQRVG